MTNITITINAPELVQAIVSLANAMEGSKDSKISVNPQQVQQVTPQAPVQNMYSQPVPQAVPQQPAVQTTYTQPAQQFTTTGQMPQQQAYNPMPQQPAPQTTVPTAAQTYTLEQLSVAGTQLVDAGRMAELQQMLASFGVNSMMQLPKEQYGAFATQLRAMGAKI